MKEGYKKSLPKDKMSGKHGGFQTSVNDKMSGKYGGFQTKLPNDKLKTGKGKP